MVLSLVQYAAKICIFENYEKLSSYTRYPDERGICDYRVFSRFVQEFLIIVYLVQRTYASGGEYRNYA